MAGQAVLLELIHTLGAFNEAIVVIGGSVPPLLYPQAANEYVGTLDIDLALSETLTDETYETIRKVLIKRGYREHKEQPFIFFRDVSMPDGEKIMVQVDLLTKEYGGTGKSHRTQKIQDIRARKVRGCDLAFINFKQVEITGELPEGGTDKVKCKVAGIVAFLTMKGMALASRMKEKDSWDIYYCLVHHPGGIEKLVGEFKAFKNNRLVREGLVKIGEKFESPDHIGPKHIVDFEEIVENDERIRIQRDAFERVNYLLTELDLR